MDKTVETDFLNLFNCYTQTGTQALCGFAVRKLLSNYGDDFTKFLENNKHYFYHQWIDKKVFCCECPPAGCSIQQNNKMETWIFKKFYSDTGIVETNHVKQTVNQKCVHRYEVQNIKIDELDISALYYLLHVCNIVTLSHAEQTAIDTLKKIRTVYSHASSTECFTNAKLNEMWRDLEIAVLNLTQPTYHKTFKTQIQFFKDSALKNEDIVRLNNEIEKLKNIMEKTTSGIQDIKDNQSAYFNAILSCIEETGDEFKQHLSECSKTNLEVVNDQNQAIKSLEMNQATMRKEQEEMWFQIKNILVKLNCHIPVKKLYPEENIKEENDCGVLWQFETPEGFDIEHVYAILKDGTTFTKEKFKVQFVRKGSLIMMTTVPLSLIYNKEMFEAAVKSFLSRLVGVCNINTDQICELAVTLHVLTTDEVNISSIIPSTDHHIQREDKAIQVDGLTVCTKCLKVSLRDDEVEKDKYAASVDPRHFNPYEKTTVQEIYRREQKVTTTISKREFNSKYYKIESGRVLILNNTNFNVPGINLAGSTGMDKDASSICQRFSALPGFEDYQWQADLTKLETFEWFDEVKIELKKNPVDCLILVLLSHGNEDGIYAVDQHIKFSDIVSIFNAEHCLELRFKPKVIITQACIDTNLRYRLNVEFDPNQSDAEIPDTESLQWLGIQNVNIPNEVDCLFAYATFPGAEACSHREKGSSFIQHLCDALNKMEVNEDFYSVLTTVIKTVDLTYQPQNQQMELNRVAQMPFFVSQLTKILCLKQN